MGSILSTAGRANSVMGAKSLILAGYLILAAAITVALILIHHDQQNLHQNDQKLVLIDSRLAGLACQQELDHAVWTRLVTGQLVELSEGCQQLAVRIQAGRLEVAGRYERLRP